MAILFEQHLMKRNYKKKSNFFNFNYLYENSIRKVFQNLLKFTWHAVYNTKRIRYSFAFEKQEI